MLYMNNSVHVIIAHCIFEYKEGFDIIPRKYSLRIPVSIDNNSSYNLHTIHVQLTDNYRVSLTFPGVPLVSPFRKRKINFPANGPWTEENVKQLRYASTFLLHSLSCYLFSPFISSPLLISPIISSYNLSLPIQSFHPYLLIPYLITPIFSFLIRPLSSHLLSNFIISSYLILYLFILYLISSFLILSSLISNFIINSHLLYYHLF